MSHLIEISNFYIRNLEILKQVCRKLGLEFCEGQRLAKSYGGRNNECSHAIKVSGTGFEIAVNERTVKIKGRNEKVFVLSADFYGTEGQTITRKCGQNLNLIEEHYGVMEAKKKAMLNGYKIKESSKVKDGLLEIELTLSRGE